MVHVWHIQYGLLANGSEIIANSRCQNSQIAVVSKLADKLFGKGRFVSSDQYKAKIRTIKFIETSLLSTPLSLSF